MSLVKLVVSTVVVVIVIVDVLLVVKSCSISERLSADLEFDTVSERALAAAVSVVNIVEEVVVTVEVVCVVVSSYSISLQTLSIA